MLILKAVSLKPLHGYGVLQRIQQISGDALEIPQGSLYPALYRLEHQELIAAEWGDLYNRLCEVDKLDSCRRHEQSDIYAYQNQDRRNKPCQHQNRFSVVD